ncbi:MAG TPA: heavy metal sensor histidine kinase [Gemmataceae bacterium]|nr:heavy metal sensor histidine kinase [Gemmataceae bacterium]
MRLSIRWRLTLWNTLALGVVLLGFSGLVYGLLARALWANLDRSLLGEFRELEQDPQLASHFDERLRYWINELKEQENICCIVYDVRGRIYQRTADLAVETVPPLLSPPGEETRVANANLPGLGRQRLLSHRLRRGDKDFTVVLLAPLDEADRELRQLLVVLAAAGPIALFAAGGFGYLLARKGLAPVERLHRLTQEITAERLDRRLPVENANDELGRLTGTINAMIGRLERSFAEIRRFTADASHELRTPLTAIRSETEVALRNPLSTADYQHLLGSILEECDRLTRLTDQLLTLCREDTGTAHLSDEPLDLGKLVSGVVETMRPFAEGKGLRVRAARNGALVIHGDEARLRQVFYNLLDNAIKYTLPGGTIDVQLRCQEQSAVVTIGDTGIGIPAEHLPRIFDRFYRVDKARSREQGGTGLGLSIARSIVDAHGGNIHITSALGQGTICTVTLPQQANG